MYRLILLLLLGSSDAPQAYPWGLPVGGGGGTVHPSWLGSSAGSGDQTLISDSTWRALADSDSNRCLQYDTTTDAFSAYSLGYQFVNDEGTTRTKRLFLNFAGDGVACVDDAGGDQTTCTVSAGGGGAPTDAPYVTHATDATLSAERVLSNGTGTTVDNGTAGQSQIDCNSAAAATMGCIELDNHLGGTAAAPTVVDVACSSACIADTELVSNYSGTGACGANQWASTLNDNAAPTCSQPAFSNLSGAASIAQGGTTETASTEDAVLVGSGTGDWQSKVIPDCDTAATSKLLYDQTTNAFSCGTDQTSAGGSGPSVLRVTGSDFVNNSNPTAYANVTGLTTAVSNGETVNIDCLLIVTAGAATTGQQFALNGPTASFIRLETEYFSSATAKAVYSCTTFDCTTAATGTFPTASGGTTHVIVQLTGQAVFTANGTLAIRGRAEINTGNLTVYRGSRCLVTK